jgi:hypothetical protein
MLHMKPSPAVVIESHPPERRRRTETLMCGCCCCCCCCLHTIGGLIGSAIAPAFGRKDRLPLHYYYDEEYGIELPSIARGGMSAVPVFWMLTGVFAVLVMFLSMLSSGRGESIVVGLIILALTFPGVQLAAAVCVAIWLGISQRHDKAYQFKQLGKITLGLVLGTVAGILAMVAIGVMMSAF